MCSNFKRHCWNEEQFFSFSFFISNAQILKRKKEQSIFEDKHSVLPHMVKMIEKAMVMQDCVSLTFRKTFWYVNSADDFIQTHLSLEWVVPHRNQNYVELTVQHDIPWTTYFDIQKFPFIHIQLFMSYEYKIDFDSFYNVFVAPDLSKDLE